MPEKESVPTRASVLREAEKLITGDRNQTYGPPTQNFRNIADMWNTRLQHKLKPGEEITPAEVAELMILLKIARNMTELNRDTMVDIAGYAACGWECAEELS